MKFKLKALVAAVALAAVAGQASANIVSPPAVGTPGEVVFYAFGQDASGNFATYVKDLGVTYDAFFSTPGYAPVDLSQDANWTAFTGNASLVGPKGWVVAATATQGGTGLNSRKILTTFTNDSFGVGVTNGPMTTAYANFNAGLAAINLFDGTSNATNNSYYFDTTTNGLDRNLGWKLGGDFGTTGVFPSAANVLGTTTSANFYQVIKTSATSGVAATISDIDAATAAWTLSGNSLSYTVAAVPEPETYGMLAAGLLMLGAVARRRRAQ